MNEDVFNTSLRGFLKKVGITSQREIEKAVRDAVASGKLKGNEKLPAKMVLTIGGVGVNHHLVGLPGAADGVQTVGVRALAANEAIAAGSLGKGGVGAQIKLACLVQLIVEQAARLLAIATNYQLATGATAVALGLAVVIDKSHFCRNLAKHFVRQKLGNKRLGLGFLRTASDVDAASVLGSRVIALAVQCCGIVDHKEDLQDLIERNECRIERDLHHFVMPRAACADLLVSWVDRLTVAVARFDGCYAFDLEVNGFGAPKAAAA